MFENAIQLFCNFKVFLKKQIQCKWHFLVKHNSSSISCHFHNSIHLPTIVQRVVGELGVMNLPFKRKPRHLPPFQDDFLFAIKSHPSPVRSYPSCNYAASVHVCPSFSAFGCHHSNFTVNSSCPCPRLLLKSASPSNRSVFTQHGYLDDPDGDKDVGASDLFQQSFQEAGIWSWEQSAKRGPTKHMALAGFG